MILAYIIYIFLCVFMVGSAQAQVVLLKKSNSILYWNFITILSVIFFSLMLGLRYEVGTDYQNYYFAYIDQFKYVYDLNWEPSFCLMYKILYYLNASPAFLFILICFIQITIFYNIFKDKVYLLPYAVFLLFITGHIFGWLNILRQSLAVLILLYGIKYVYLGSFWKLLVCILLAATFHISSLSFIPVIFLCKIKHKTILDNKWIQLIVYSFCIVKGSHLYDFIILQFIDLLANVDDYSLPLIGGQWQTELSSGLGRIINIIIVIITILISNRLYKIFGMSYMQYYRIYYIGQLLLVIAGLDMNMRRIAACYSVASLVVLSYFLFYLLNYWKSLSALLKLIGTGIIGLYILMFLQKIYIGESQCSPFQFILLK